MDYFIDFVHDLDYETCVPILEVLGNVLIRMYADDHHPPHFHVDTPKFRALVRIADLEVHRGTLDGRTLRLVREWAQDNRARLEAEWEAPQ